MIIIDRNVVRLQLILSLWSSSVVCELYLIFGKSLDHLYHSSVGNCHGKVMYMCLVVSESVPKMLMVDNVRTITDLHVGICCL